MLKSLRAYASLALVLVLWSRGLWAASLNQLQVELDVAQDEVPHALCVLTKRANVPGAIALSELLGAGFAAKPPINLCALPPQGIRDARERLSKDPKTRLGIGLAVDAFTRDACTDTADSNPAGGIVFGDSAELCQPLLEVPRDPPSAQPPADWHMTCAINEQRRDGGPIALVRLEPPPAIPGKPERPDRIGAARVHLDGTVASVELSGSLDNGDFVVATVAGGSYLSERSHYNTPDGRLRLSLHARCVTRAVSVPSEMKAGLRASIGRDRQLIVPRTAAGPSTSVDVQTTDRQQLMVKLPRLPGDYLLRVESISPQSNASNVVAEAHWRGGVELPTPVLQRKNVSFTWTRHCLYGKWNSSPGSPSWCPTAELAELAASCHAVPQGDACTYTCAATDVRQAMSLPATVQFRGHTVDEAWTDTLIHPQQRLNSYVPTEARQIRVQRWATSKADADIEEVELTDKVGRTHTLLWDDEHSEPDVSSPLWVSAPGVGCNDSYRVTALGEWRYDDEKVKLNEGTLQLTDPADSRVDEWAWGLVASAGMSAITWDQFSATRPWALAGALFRRRPLMSSWSQELRVGGMIAERRYKYRYSGVMAEGEPVTRDHATWYVHFPIELHFPYVVKRSGFAIDPFVGWSIGHPTPAEERKKTGGYDGALTLGVITRHALTRQVAFELSLRGFWFEQLNLFDTDQRGTVRQQEISRSGWSQLMPFYGMVGIGFRFGYR